MAAKLRPDLGSKPAARRRARDATRTWRTASARDVGSIGLVDVTLAAGRREALGLPSARAERTQNLPRVGDPTKQGLDHQQARLVIGSRQVTTKRLGTAIRQQDA